jgi:hypothetical protein
MALQDTFSCQIMDHILGTTQHTYVAAPLYLALGTDTTPSSSVFTECQTSGQSGGGYTRQAITFAAATGVGIATNSASCSFGPCAGTAWGTLKSFAVFNVSGAGTRRIQGVLTDQTKIVGIGDSATVAAGAITVTAS